MRCIQALHEHYLEEPKAYRGKKPVNDQLIILIDSTH